MDWSWILLVFLVLLQFSETNGRRLDQTVKEGANVSLFCEKVTPDQPQCEFTDWEFYKASGQPTTVFFKKGQKKNVSSGVSLSENCSLVLDRVSEEQAGHYFCSQYNRENKLRGITYNFLSVVTLSENRDEDRVTLNCSVTRYKNCGHKVKWLNNSEEVNKQLQTSHSDCEASVSFLDQDRSSQFYQTLKCEVTDDTTKQKFTFSPRPAEINPGTTTKTTPTVRTRRTKNYGLLVSVPVVSAAIVVAVVVFIVCRKKRGPRTGADGNNADPEDTVIYSSISISNHNTQSRDNDDTVTYSCVRASAADSGPSRLYSNVNKPKKQKNKF